MAKVEPGTTVFVKHSILLVSSFYPVTLRTINMPFSRVTKSVVTLSFDS
jgi:hypothetical protein